MISARGSNDDENRETIVDYSGNGNNAVAHNIAWSGMSGYGGYGDVHTFKDYNSNNAVATYSISENRQIVTITNCLKDSGAFLYIQNNRAVTKCKVTGLQTGQSIKWGNDKDESAQFEITKDGIYDINWSKSTGYKCWMCGFIGECNITIEQIPLYPGALVLDGVDDYISLDAFKDKGFRTVFILVHLINYNIMPYESRKVDKNGHFLIHTTNMLSKENIAGNLYINNKLVEKSSLSTADNNKKILLSVINPTALDTDFRTPMINKWIGGVSPTTAIYKFLGFKEALTEEQIKAVIDKYNLLDGVDEIEVS